MKATSNLFLSFFLAFVVGFVLFVVSSQADQLHVMNELTRNTVQLINGTGFIALGKSGKRYVITNEHVCTSEKNAVNVKVDEKKDLCATNVVITDNYLELGDLNYEGQEVNTFGYPNHSAHFSHGHLVGLQDWSRKKSHCTLIPLFAKANTCTIFHTSWDTTLYSQPGSSGSPVLDDEGKLVGVISSYTLGNSNGGGMIPLSDLKSFLEEL